MADRKISELTNITGANLADDDEFALVDTSADQTKAITFGEFKTALDTATGFVRITGDTMTGNLTVPNVVVSGNVDGRDVSADGTKLDTVETNADVTDATNVTAAGALMDSELANLAAVKAINQGLSTSDSPTFNTVTVGGTSDPSSEMTILSSIGGTSELRLGDTDADAGSIKYFNSNDQLVFRAAAATRAVFSSTGAAVTGKTTTDELDLNAIAATISDTAVDVFVYDTSKDSDGGAWRKRTQHTSWYNEAASATRGSRKEFPAVAVIVSTSASVTIYDGDDPDMPMWMVFTSASGTILRIASGIYSISMLNGLLVLASAHSGVYGMEIIDFTKDKTKLIGSAIYNWTNNQVANRNAAGALINIDPTGGILNAALNDVAMTVLPNAPIDSATGLPVPTIAVATDGGVSVIKDDGTVVDITDATDAFGTVEFTQTNRLIIGYKVYTGMMVSGGIPVADTTRSNWSSYYYQNTSVPALTGGAAKKVAEYNFGDSYGLTLLEENETSMAQGSVAYITSDYNTGHMVGDIKLATLSDTSTTNVTGAELVDNGNFNNGGDWSFGGGWNFANGQAEIDTTNNDLLSQDIGMVSGKTYTVSLVMTAYTDGVLDVRLGGTATQTATGTGVHTFTGVAGGSTLQIYAFTNATLSIDDISVRLAEEDRSVNGNGLQVFGTVNKSAVATGADLVAYSGFSTSNKLIQPYNSNLDFGTGDFCYMAWVKTVSNVNNNSIVARGVGGSTTGFVYISVNSSGNLSAYVSSTSVASSLIVPTGVWTHCAVIRKGSSVYGYVNGVEDHIFSSTDTVTNSAAFLTVGNSSYGQDLPTNSSLALLRISATAPSPEQIAKIYNDEKHLFQTGAQATLYGSSDAVTALAYDDSTDLLHVGTSAGRSVFQGLRRVDNTTDAVGAAISASNGLVAED